MPLLKPGDHFPSITITPVDGEAIDLPDALAGHFAVILFNRGSWCPYCNAQLRAFQRHAEKLDGLDVKVVSLSVDDEATARELIAKHGLTFPVGHSADAAAIHEATGAFVNADPVYLQSTGFVLDPDGNVVVSVYSSGAIGRLCPRTSPAWSTTSSPCSPHDHNHDDRRRARARRLAAQVALAASGSTTVVGTTAVAGALHSRWLRADTAPAGRVLQRKRRGQGSLRAWLQRLRSLVEPRCGPRSTGRLGHVPSVPPDPSNPAGKARSVGR